MNIKMSALHFNSPTFQPLNVEIYGLMNFFASKISKYRSPNSTQINTIPEKFFELVLPLKRNYIFSPMKFLNFRMNKSLSIVRVQVCRTS